jgi:lysozyme family protein
MISVKANHITRLFGAVLTITVVVASTNASALTRADYSQQGIKYYDSAASAACQPETAPVSTTDTTAVGGNNGNKDYKGRQILSDSDLAKIKANQPIYEQAATAAKIPWQLIAVIHLRESGLSRTNPGNGQGIFQNSGGEGGPYPSGPVSDAEFLRQATFAANRIRTNYAGDQASKLAAGDPEAVKYTLFGYNGRAAVYTKQALALGFTNGYEGSPYVMNKADAKRDPDSAAPNTWGQVKHDGGGIEYPANSDYGAFVVYAALANIPSSGGSCTGSAAGVDPRVGPNGWEVTGANAMVLYNQLNPPWGPQKYGNGTIKDCGCGPTSMAMIVATLTKDASVTPKTMADFFVANGAQDGGCASNWGLFNSNSPLAKKYGLTITNIGTDLTKVGPAVKAGSIILMSQATGYFTKGDGHILTIRGVTPSGNFLVADPASNSNTQNETGFTSALISKNLKNLWIVSLGAAKA